MHSRIANNSGRPGTAGAPAGDAGVLVIGDGYIEVDGWIVENMAHGHLAFQLTIGLDGPVELIADGKTLLAAEAVLIAPHARHCIGPIGRRVRSIYVEPQLPWARLLVERLEGRSVMGGAADLIALADPPLTGIDGKAMRLRALIENAPPEEGPRDWAKASNLSPSRFRAQCIELLGAPPVRLRQWGRLKTAAKVLTAGGGVAEAAAAAGYADQAHFTRQLRRWFGVSPARGLASLKLRIGR